MFFNASSLLFFHSPFPFLHSPIEIFIATVVQEKKKATTQPIISSLSVAFLNDVCYSIQFRVPYAHDFYCESARSRVSHRLNVASVSQLILFFFSFRDPVHAHSIELNACVCVCVSANVSERAISVNMPTQRARYNSISIASKPLRNTIQRISHLSLLYVLFRLWFFQCSFLLFSLCSPSSAI